MAPSPFCFPQKEGKQLQRIARNHTADSTQTVSTNCTSLSCQTDGTNATSEQRRTPAFARNQGMIVDLHKIDFWSCQLPMGLLNEEPPEQVPSTSKPVEPRLAGAKPKSSTQQQTASGAGSAEGSNSSSNGVIIFDWDDTIFPTSFVIKEIISKLDHLYLDRNDALSEESPHFNTLLEHSRVVEKLLREACKVARVAIVTLATDMWLKRSAAHFLPGLNLPALLHELDVEVYYADRRSPPMMACAVFLEGQEVGVIAKQAAMSDCFKSIYKETTTGWNVLSVGDSPIEHEALKLCVRGGDRRYGICKTMKLQESPPLRALTESLRTLIPSLGDLVSCEKDFDDVVQNARLETVGSRFLSI